MFKKLNNCYRYVISWHVILIEISTSEQLVCYSARGSSFKFKIRW